VECHGVFNGLPLCALQNDLYNEEAQQAQRARGNSLGTALGLAFAEDFATLRLDNLCYTTPMMQCYRQTPPTIITLFTAATTTAGGLLALR